MERFNGTIQIKHNPVASWETYSRTLEAGGGEKDSGYFGLQFSQRAEGGFYRATFSMRESFEVLSDFIQNALGREVVIRSNDGTIVWEGYIHQMEYDAGSTVYKIDLGDMSNKVWIRYRVRGASTTSRSTTQSDTNSIAKYGTKEFILSGGELESTSVANGVAQQYLDLHKWPSPAPSRIDPEKELSEYPVINVGCRGWFETLNWKTYNQTVSTDNQGASAQIADVIAGVGQFVASSIIRPNATLVSKEYDADRRGGDVIRDIARLGDSANSRWVVYMDEDRIFHFEPAAPAVEQ